MPLSYKSIEESVQFVQIPFIGTFLFYTVQFAPTTRKIQLYKLTNENLNKKVENQVNF